MELKIVMKGASIYTHATPDVRQPDAYNMLMSAAIGLVNNAEVKTVGDIEYFNKFIDVLGQAIEKKITKEMYATMLKKSLDSLPPQEPEEGIQKKK